MFSNDRVIHVRTFGTPFWVSVRAGLYQFGPNVPLVFVSVCVCVNVWANASAQHLVGAKVSAPTHFAPRTAPLYPKRV